MPAVNRKLNTLRIAAIQLASGTNPEQNLAEIQTRLVKPTVNKAHLIILPENCLCHSSLTTIAANARTEKQWLELIVPATGKIKSSIVWGGLPVKAGNGKIFNTTYAISPQGEILMRYRKRHLFSLQGRNHAVCESNIYSRGRKPVGSFSIHGWLCRCPVCFDIRFPEDLRVTPHADVIICPAAFTSETGKVHWQPLLQARAIENQAFLIAANQCAPGTQNSPATYGHSLAISPWGQVIATQKTNPGIINCEFRKSEIRTARKRLSSLVRG